MADQFAGLEVAEALFKELIAKGLYSYINRSAKFYGMIEDGEGMETNSRGVRIVAEVEANPSNRSFVEGGKYAAFSFPRDVNMRVFWTRHSKGRGYSRDEYEALMSSKTSIVTGLARDIKRETGDLIKVINYMCWGNGDGVIARVDTAGSPVVTGANGTAKFAFDGGSYHILVRGRYNFINPATGLARLNGGGSAFVATATSKNSATQTVTFDTVPSDAVAGDYLVYEESYLSALHGVPYHVNNDTGLYQGQSRSLYENLRSVVIDAAVASVPQPLSTALLDRMEAQTMYLHGTTEDAEDTDEWRFWASPCQEVAYIRLGDPLHRVIKTAQTEVLNLSYKLNGKGIQHRHKWMIDTDHRDDRIDGLKLSTFKKFLAPGGTPGFIQKVEGGYWREVPSFDSSGVGGYFDRTGFYMGFRMDLGCMSPFSNGAIINLATTGLPNKKSAYA